MRKWIAAPVLVTLALAFSACGNEPDQRICADVPQVVDAIQQTSIRGDFKNELLEDVAERATEANCPGFNESDD